MTNTQAEKLINLEAKQDADRAALRKVQDELDDKNELVNTQAKKLAELEIKQDEIRTELDAKNQLIEDWRIGIGKLMAQFREIKTQPVWKPDTGPLHRDGA